MRNLSRAGTLTLVAGLALVLTGCVPQPHPIVPTSQSTVAPVFKSDAAALAAAKKAYEGYSSTSDAIGRDGGQNPERIARWVTPARLIGELKDAKSLAASHQHLEGSTAFNSFALQRSAQSGSGVARVDVYVCVDVSQTKLLDATNRDVTPANRAVVVPLEVEFKSPSPRATSLVLSESTPWSGKNFCS
jgi:hypothetical protein